MSSLAHRALNVTLLLAATLSMSNAVALEVGQFEVAAQADLRLVFSDSPYKSFMNGGLGTLRFDADHDGLRLGRIVADIKGPVTDTVRFNLTLNTTADHDAHAIDATEAFLEWRPLPRSALKSRTRVGAFYPRISLENRGIGWQSSYTLSSSAINTWIGEEVRAIGVEQSATWVSMDSSQDFAIGLVGGVYKWNDPMGVLIFQRGWALHDRQTALFGNLPRPLSQSADDKTIEFFRELDGRIGMYIGAEYQLGTHVVRALHYDNHGDPARTSGKESAWLSRFDSIGWRFETQSNTTFMMQGLRGDTSVGESTDGKGMLIVDYWSYFLMTSQQLGAHRVTLRYDRMNTHSVRGATIFNSEQTAIAWTAAYLWDISRQWQVGIEALQVSGSLQQRALLGTATEGVERSWQLAARYSL